MKFQNLTRNTNIISCVCEINRHYLYEISTYIGFRLFKNISCLAFKFLFTKNSINAIFKWSNNNSIKFVCKRHPEVKIYFITSYEEFTQLSRRKMDIEK